MRSPDAQLGLPSSPWVRAEVRLYGKHVDVPLEALLDPGAYLRGAYSVMRELIQGVCTRLKTIRKQVEVSANAAIKWSHRPVGPWISAARSLARWTCLGPTSSSVSFSKPDQRARAAKAAPPPDPYANMRVQQRYMAQLTDANRIRFVFRATMGEREVGMAEWVDSSGNTADQPLV